MQGLGRAGERSVGAGHVRQPAPTGSKLLEVLHVLDNLAQLILHLLEERLVLRLLVLLKADERSDRVDHAIVVTHRLIEVIKSVDVYALGQAPFVPLSLDSLEAQLLHHRNTLDEQLHQLQLGIRFGVGTRQQANQQREHHERPTSKLQL